MTNKEKAIEIFKLLEENHINLYHDISKEDFLIELNKFLEIADNLDQVHFDAEMCKLFSLFKDAHTTYFACGANVNVNIKHIEGKFYLYNVKENLCEEIKQVNGMPINEVYSKLKAITQYEFDSWANRCVANKLTNLYCLKMIDCVNIKNSNEVEYLLESDKIIIAKKERVNSNNKPNYSFSINNNILVIDYFKCLEMPDYPFKRFVEDIKKECANLPDSCLVDLRGNTGGSSQIILPLIDWLEEEHIKTYVLMNESVFSSGTFALFYLKKYLNATFVGTDAGQGGCRYGQQKEINVEDCYFACSEKKFDFVNKCGKSLGKFFAKDHAIKPDIYLPEKVEDVKLGIDGQLRDCLEIITKDLNVKNNL